MDDDKLLDLVARAIADPGFFKALLADVDGALRSYNIALSDKDRKRLKDALTDPPSRVTVDLPKFLAAVHEKGLGNDLAKFGRWVVRWVGHFRWVDFFKK